MKSLKIKAILVITANFTKLATFTTSTTTNATTNTATATTRVSLNDDPLNEKLLANYQHRNSECH